MAKGFSTHAFGRSTYKYPFKIYSIEGIVDFLVSIEVKRHVIFPGVFSYSQPLNIGVDLAGQVGLRRGIKLVVGDPAVLFNDES